MWNLRFKLLQLNHPLNPSPWPLEEPLRHTSWGTFYEKCLGFIERIARWSGVDWIFGHPIFSYKGGGCCCCFTKRSETMLGCQMSAMLLADPEMVVWNKWPNDYNPAYPILTKTLNSDRKLPPALKPKQYSKYQPVLLHQKHIYHPLN